MTKRFALLAVLTLLFLMGFGASSAFAQKIGYTDHELIIVNMPEYRTIQDQLQKDYQAGQAEMQTLAADYQDKLDKYQKQQALLSPERRQEREKELVQLQQKLQQQAQVKDTDMQQKQANLMRPLFEKVQTAIDDVAKTRGLDLVIRSQVGDQPVILFRNENTVTDITLDVAKKLGLEVKETAEGAPASTPSAQPTAAGK